MKELNLFGETKKCASKVTLKITPTKYEEPETNLEIEIVDDILILSTSRLSRKPIAINSLVSFELAKNLAKRVRTELDKLKIPYNTDGINSFCSLICEYRDEGIIFGKRLVRINAIGFINFKGYCYVLNDYVIFAHKRRVYCCKDNKVIAQVKIESHFNSDTVARLLNELDDVILFDPSIALDYCVLHRDYLSGYETYRNRFHEKQSERKQIHLKSYIRCMEILEEAINS